MTFQIWPWFKTLEELFKETKLCKNLIRRRLSFQKMTVRNFFSNKLVVKKDPLTLRKWIIARDDNWLFFKNRSGNILTGPYQSFCSMFQKILNKSHYCYCGASLKVFVLSHAWSLDIIVSNMYECGMAWERRYVYISFLDFQEEGVALILWLWIKQYYKTLKHYTVQLEGIWTWNLLKAACPVRALPTA